MMRAAVVALFLVTSLPVAAAEKESPFDTGNTFNAQCRAAKEKDGNGIDFGLCYGFVRGIIERDSMLLPPLRSMCIPAGVTWGQEIDIILSYLDKNPESRHLPASFLSIMGLRLAFPCASAKQAP